MQDLELSSMLNRFLKERLDSYNLPGTAFRTIHYKPIAGQNPQTQHGVQFFYTDYEAATITLTQFYVMQALQELYPERNPYKVLKKTRMLDIVCGTDYVRREFGKRLKVEDIESRWMQDAGCRSFQGTFPTLLLISITLKRKSHEKDDQHLRRTSHHLRDDRGP